MRYNPGNPLTAEPLAHKPRVLLVANDYVPGSCWEVLGRRGRRLWPHQYAQVRTEAGRTVQAHRWAWASANGPIPKHIQIHHMCFNKRCMNPSHLDAITAGENARLSNFPQRSVWRGSNA